MVDGLDMYFRIGRGWVVHERGENVRVELEDKRGQAWRRGVEGRDIGDDCAVCGKSAMAMDITSGHTVKEGATFHGRSTEERSDLH